MSNHMKFCGCERCKAGKHHSARGKAKVKKAVKSNRRKVKMALNKGLEPPAVIDVGYTDF